VAWFRHELDISFPPCFLTLDTSSCILDAPMSSMSFVQSFVIEAFQEDFNTIINLLMFVDPQKMFRMFSLCYARCPSYFLRTMFLFLSILKHYKLSLHLFMYHGYVKNNFRQGIFQH